MQLTFAMKGHNMKRPGAVLATPAGPDRYTNERGSSMADDSHYPDFEGARKHWSEETRWQPLSVAVARLKAKVERAYHECRDDDAAQAHDDLTSAEWRLRQAERRR